VIADEALTIALKVIVGEIVTHFKRTEASADDSDIKRILWLLYWCHV
jgi:hypothetical protein